MIIAHTNIKKAFPIFLATLVLATGGQGLGAEKLTHSSLKVETLVRHIVNAYGGTAVLVNVHSFSSRGVLESPMYGKPADYSLDVKQSRKLRVKIGSGDSFELRILNGMHGYYQTADSPMVAVSGSRLLSMAYQYKEINMPNLLMSSSFTIVDGGESMVNGVRVRRLLLSDSEGPPIKLYVDLKSYRIIKDSGIFTMDGVETELSSEFYDFKKVGGRLFPFRVINYAGGQRIGELRVHEYRVNPQLPDSLFTPGAAAKRSIQMIFSGNR